MEIKIDRLVRTKRKSITLVVLADATLIVKAPMQTPLSYIEKLVQQKHKWIRKKQNQAKMRPVFKAKEFIAGESFYLLGRAYPLEIVTDMDNIIELNDTLRMAQKKIKRARETLTAWYKKQAQEIINDRVRHFSRQTRLVPSLVRITGARKRWGSCGPTGNLNFSWRLVMAPLEVVDYVVVHELVHLKIKNHSALFKNSVKAILPDSVRLEKWLKINGYSLDF
jgi:predicted metal-dependent hydrolase